MIHIIVLMFKGGIKLYYYNSIEQPGRIRFVNALFMGQPIDIYINDRPILRGLNYRQATQFIPIPNGMYNVKVYTTNSNNLLANQNINIEGNKLITITQDATGAVMLNITEDVSVDQGFMPQMPPQQPFMPPFETRDTTVSGRARVRFIHFSPNAPAVDITLPNGMVLFRNIPYHTITDYINVASGTYTLQVRPTGTDQVVLTIPDVVLNPNDVSTIYAIGLVNSTPMFEALVVNERSLV